MSRQVVRRPKAREDFIEIHAHLGEFSLRKADRFFRAADSILALIAKFPDLGGPYRTSNPRLSKLRRSLVPRFPEYSIFYLPGEDAIDVVRVLHGSRDIQSILGKE